MSGAGLIRVRFCGDLGQFRLDAAFEVPARGVTVLFGPSGCGKTTVLRCIAGLTRIPEGSCVIDEAVWQDGRRFTPPYRREVGYVFQDASLFPHLSVENNLMFGTPRDSRHGGTIAFDAVIELLGLGRLLDRAPRHLSGGERQRVAIGRALLSQPKLLLMDEPLSALDRPTREEILPFLEQLHERLALPVIYVTHDRTEVERLADTVVLMADGRVTAFGALADLQGNPHLPLALARDAAVSLAGKVVGFDPAYGLTTIEVDGARLIVPGLDGDVGDRRRVRIAAGDVSLSLRPREDSTILNSLPARIVKAARVGDHEMLAVLRAGAEGEGATVLSRVTRRSWERLALAEGMMIHAQIKSVALVPSGRR